jgi:glycosyltransferase involved in cell wall biosynthesis
MRIAIFSHAHPNFSKGGGEIAAYSLFEGINALPGHEAWFIGRAEQQMLHLGSPVASLNAREYLIGSNADIPRLSATLALGEDSDFADMLRTIDPDVIHFHHYVFLGLEMIHAAKRICPRAKIVLTLHEFIGICLNSGQMIKTDGRLCYRSSPRECHGCFPQTSMEDIFLREVYVKSFFDLVDTFVSPSDFLKDRYVTWGLPADKIIVIENGLEDGHRLPPRRLPEGKQRGRFAYFGQINHFKGIDLILEAFLGLPKAVRKQVSLDIYGSGLEYQQEDFRNKVGELLRQADKQAERMVRFHGAYEREELGGLMEGVDWVVMGSKWWENSPVVIQEAFKFGRPVICPDIGGMAEKVQPGLGGLNFRARDSLSLQNLIVDITEGQVDYDALVRDMPSFLRQSDCAEAHLKLYH